MKILPRGSTGAKKTIVLIEDEEIILELLRSKLEAIGMRVYTAQDGISGLQLIRDRKPDLVLLDILLPGITGMQILEKMWTEGLLPATPVLIISNSGQPVEIARAMELGARDYLVKVNFDPQEVLDRAQAILGTALPAHPRANAAAAGRRVMIIEDDTLLIDLLERRFALNGYTVQKALDAEQARRMLDKEAPDIILLDLVLSGIDGFALLAELKRDKRHKKIPVVIISNLGQQEEIERGMRLGAADYIVKANISPAEIVKKISALLKYDTRNA